MNFSFSLSENSSDLLCNLSMQKSFAFALYVPIGHWVGFKILIVNEFEPHDGGDFY